MSSPIVLCFSRRGDALRKAREVAVSPQVLEIADVGGWVAVGEQLIDSDGDRYCYVYGKDGTCGKKYESRFCGPSGGCVILTGPYDF